jgi:uncharacterized protein YhfF
VADCSQQKIRGIKMTVEQYWKEYKEKSKDKAEIYSAWYFCDNEKDAEELAKLVIEGRKRATASSVWVYEYEKSNIPKVGDLSVITEFFGEPMCIIKTVRVDVLPFGKVSAEFAACEGEGDSSLGYWRDAHRRFFTRECESIKRNFTEDMPVVCERFEVVYI